MSEIVEWKQTNLEDYFSQYIDTMDKAIELGKQLKDVGERCEIAIGKLANHVEKGKWNGGIRAFARGIGIPSSTVHEWASATRTPELSAAADILGTKKVAVIERAPDGVKETVWEWVDTQEKEPSHKEITKKIREVKIETAYIENNTPTREDIVQDSIENIENYLKPNSVDLILTDPPYAEDSLPLWEILAQKASILLKPSGFLVAYSGHYHLPSVVAALSSSLEYVWTIALIHSGSFGQVDARHIRAGWKPIFVYCRTPYIKQDWMVDIIHGSGREKDDHEWQQGLSEAEDLVQKFSQKNALVVDPFLGSGTTILAAKKTERNFFGMDTDELAIKTTLRRLQHEE